MENAQFAPKPCQTPTNALAGSGEKIAIFIKRLEAGEELFHPMDNPRMVDRRQTAVA